MIHNIKKLTSYKEILEIFPLIHQHYDMSKNEFAKNLQEMVKNGYNAIAIFINKELVGISGYWISRQFHNGKTLRIDNFIIHKNYQNIGVGKKMLSWLEKEAKQNCCERIILDSYIENANAHNFYFREGFFIRSFGFNKIL